MNIGGSILVLRRFQIDETGASGAHVLIEAREAGLINFILTLIGLDPNSSLKVTRGSISFRTSSVFGSSQVSTPLPNIGAFVGGYKKPFLALVLSAITLISGFFFFLLIGVFYGDLGLIFTLTMWVISLVSLIYYLLNKVMFIGFETSGGGTYGFAFKASVIEGVGVDINRVEQTIDFVNSLISSAALGEVVLESAKPKAIGGRQSTLVYNKNPVAQQTAMPLPVYQAQIQTTANQPLPAPLTPVLSQQQAPVQPAVNQPLPAPQAPALFQQQTPSPLSVQQAPVQPAVNQPLPEPQAPAEFQQQPSKPQ